LGTIPLSREHKPIISKDTSRKNSIKLEVTYHHTAENGDRKKLQLSHVLTASSEMDFNWWYNVLSSVIGVSSTGLKKVMKPI